MSAQMQPELRAITSCSKADITADELRALVDRLSPSRANAPRSEWVKVGMAIYDADPSDFGYSLFEAFSRQSPKFNARDCRTAWKSFRPGKVTVATLIKYANEDTPMETQRTASAKCDHADPASYPAEHGCTWDDFARWNARPTTFTEYGKAYDAIAFPDDTGVRYRLFNHPAAKFKPERSGLAPCWYGLREAADLAARLSQPLVIVNGQPSVIACQARGVPACTIPGGEGNIAGHLERGLLKNLQAAWNGPITILLDGDNTGYTSAPKVAHILRAAGYTVSAKDAGPGHDAADVCRLHNGTSAQAIAGLPELATSDRPSDQQVINTEITPPRFTVASEDELFALPPLHYLDRDLCIVARAFHLIYGASGSGKTFFAIERAMRLASAGYRVLYIPTEDVSGLRYRVAAWRLAHPDASGKLTWLQMPNGLDLQDHNQVAELLEAITPYTYDYIVLDTLREAHSGDENSSQDTARIDLAIQSIIKTGAAVDVVHHTGVNGERPRGSTALFGNADVVLKIENDDGFVRVSYDKIRNGERRDTLLYGIVHQDTGLLDADGQPVPGAILRPASQVTTRNAKLTPTQRKVLETLALSIFDNIGAKAQQVIDTSEITRRHVYLALSALKNRGFVTQADKGDPYYITTTGRAQLGPELTPAPASDLPNIAPASASDPSDQEVISSDLITTDVHVIHSDHTHSVITGSHTDHMDTQAIFTDETFNTSRLANELRSKGSRRVALVAEYERLIGPLTATLTIEALEDAVKDAGGESCPS